jgi:DNA-binding NarL/FixJ family response regulator
MIETSGQSNEPIRVAIAEDDRAMREGLGMLISGAPGYACAGEFRPVEVAMRSLGRQQPDVLLLDIQLPGMPGSEGVRVSREKFPQTEIIMPIALAEQEKVFESICNGDCGYLLK